MTLQEAYKELEKNDCDVTNMIIARALLRILALLGGSSIEL